MENLQLVATGKAPLLRPGAPPWRKRSSGTAPRQPALQPRNDSPHRDPKTRSDEHWPSPLAPLNVARMHQPRRCYEPFLIRDVSDG